MYPQNDFHSDCKNLIFYDYLDNQVCQEESRVSVTYFNRKATDLMHDLYVMLLVCYINRNIAEFAKNMITGTE